MLVIEFSPLVAVASSSSSIALFFLSAFVRVRPPCDELVLVFERPTMVTLDPVSEPVKVKNQTWREASG